MKKDFIAAAAVMLLSLPTLAAGDRFVTMLSRPAGIIGKHMTVPDNAAGHDTLFGDHADP